MTPTKFAHLFKCEGSHEGTRDLLLQSSEPCSLDFKFSANQKLRFYSMTIGNFHLPNHPKWFSLISLIFKAVIFNLISKVKKISLKFQRTTHFSEIFKRNTIFTLIFIQPCRICRFPFLILTDKILWNDVHCNSI